MVKMCIFFSKEQPPDFVDLMTGVHNNHRETPNFMSQIPISRPSGRF
jgi:hypothetical protein